MHAVTHHLHELREELKEIERRINEESQAIETTQKRRDDATARETALKTKISDFETLNTTLDTDQSAIDAQKAGAKHDIEAGREFRDRLFQQLDPHRRRLPIIEKTVENIDRVIHELHERAKRLEREEKRAEKEVAEAQKRADDLEQQFRNTPARLADLRQRIETTRADALNLRTQARTEVEGGEPEQALYLAHALGLKLAHLEHLISPESEAEINEVLKEFPRRFQEAQRELHRCQLALERLKHELEYAVKERDRKIKDRDEDILAAMIIATEPEYGERRERTERYEGRERHEGYEKTEQPEGYQHSERAEGNEKNEEPPGDGEGSGGDPDKSGPKPPRRPNKP